jgi:hypothetical protein
MAAMSTVDNAICPGAAQLGIMSSELAVAVINNRLPSAAN